ncbi:MAG: DUF2182 domain-containing protein [Pyrinomonadaceae bacterium]|nr:DUF2182 domain-containing protein [Pyrinomonadaceae bacterium]
MANSMSGMKPMMISDWTPGYFLMMFVMWVIMMIGMMVPTVAPTVLIYAAIARKAANQGTPVAPTSAFVAGYIAMWTVFSLLATVAQFGLDKAALLSPMMVSKSPVLGAVLLVSAGVYQFLPLKNSCLKNCRSPVEFISTYWKNGVGGAFRMGLHHGVYCLGCCWVLMLLLFVGGVMNLLWIAIITAFVLLEKVLPMGDRGGKVFGALMIAVGVLFAIRAW